jgi:predicted nucleic acid-binding protein
LDLGIFLALVSEELKQEINTVLSRSKFVSLDKKRRILLGTLFNQAVTVRPQKIDKIVFTDENDHFLYELAVAGSASAIDTNLLAGDLDKLLPHGASASGEQHAR